MTTIIFAFGIILALSAFKIWPDSVDAFITDTLYPAFVYLSAVSALSIYALIKTRSDLDSKSDSVKGKNCHRRLFFKYVCN